MADDASGRVAQAVTASAGIEISSADSQGLGPIEFPEHPSNVTIGGGLGSILFVMAQSSIYAFDLE